MFESIYEFESALAKYTGAPYVVATDCCTHAIELCFRVNRPTDIVAFTPNTYISIPMIFHKLHLKYAYLPSLSGEQWVGEYKFHNTNVWDSARMLKPNMYRKSQMQCLSFGHDKPLAIGRGGAILLDNYDDYFALKRMTYDGRDLEISPWSAQDYFQVGYHYKMTIEEAITGLEMLSTFEGKSQKRLYPDLHKIQIRDFNEPV